MRERNDTNFLPANCVVESEWLNLSHNVQHVTISKGNAEGVQYSAIIGVLYQTPMCMNARIYWGSTFGSCRLFFRELIFSEFLQRCRMNFIPPPPSSLQPSPGSVEPTKWGWDSCTNGWGAGREVVEAVEPMGWGGQLQWVGSIEPMVAGSRVS